MSEQLDTHLVNLSTTTFGAEPNRHGPFTSTSTISDSVHHSWYRNDDESIPGSWQTVDVFAADQIGVRVGAGSVSLRITQSRGEDRHPVEVSIFGNNEVGTLNGRALLEQLRAACDVALEAGK